ncbi:MAG: hypothetical protein ACFFC1_21240 [Promethearchaeota archaeon]
MNKVIKVFFLILIFSSNNFAYFTICKNNCINIDLQVKTCPGPFPSEDDSIELTTFPVDLDLLYYQDNLTMLNTYLNELGNGSSIWPVSPWNAHFYSNHIEGADKWYFNNLRCLPVKAPHNGDSNYLGIMNGSVFTYNGHELVSDLGLEIDIGNDFTILFGHIDLLKPIYDEIQTSGTYSFIEGEHIGYLHNWTPFGYGLDFCFMYKYHSICPLKYLRSDVQNTLLEYYNLTYERMKISGKYPESKICNNHTCEIENTVWGVWEYDTGPWDIEFQNPEISYAFGAWTFFNRNFTNSETFYRDPKDPLLNLTDDVIGVFADSFPVEISGYKKLDHCLIKLISEEGNYEVGIFELINNLPNDWGPQDTSVYARFSIARHDIGPQDDILILEFFADLLSAQIGFSNDNFTLTRYYHFTISEETEETSRTGMVPIAQQALIALLVIVMIPVIIIRKQKKLDEHSQPLDKDIQGLS